MRVADYERAKQWYIDKLDFRVVREWPWEGLQLAYLCPPDDDDFHIEIFGGGSPEPVRQYADVVDSMKYPGYHHFCLSVDNVDDTLAELRRRGVLVVAEPFELKEISARLALFADPWGNIIEISQPLG